MHSINTFHSALISTPHISLTILGKMVFYHSWKHLLAITLAIFLAGTSPRQVLGQNCGCADYYCCSKNGYCGIGLDYCGDGCQSGNCYPLPPSNNVSVSDIVTDAFFNGIADQASADCPGKGFYTRAAFLEAIRFYPQFGTVGFEEDSKREIAAFFAHVTHETGHLCYIEENDVQSDYCDRNDMQNPCTPGKRYYGRGPLQLTWNYNYGPAGRNLSLNLLNNPEFVATNPVVSFRTSLWFWMVNCHYSINAHRGFGVTIRAINGIECDGGNPSAVNARVGFYEDYCNQFQVDPGTYLSCNLASEAISSVAIK